MAHIGSGQMLLHDRADAIVLVELDHVRDVLNTEVHLRAFAGRLAVGDLGGIVAIANNGLLRIAEQQNPDHGAPHPKRQKYLIIESIFCQHCVEIFFLVKYS